MQAVITGATSGIGRALAERLLAAGETVIGVGRDEEKLADLAAAWPERFRPVLIDLADPAARASCAAALAEFGAVDALVNNAAWCVYEPPLTFSLENWRTLLEVNLLTTIELTQALVARIPSGGQIVNVSSVTARHLANARFSPYALTKAALEQFTEALRLEVAAAGIRVSLVVPGLVDTPMYQKVRGFSRAEARLRRDIPAWLTAEDVAEAIHWILARPSRVVISEVVLLPQHQPR